MKKSFLKLYENIKKNLKVVLRNYVLIFLLIIGPLFLILLIGFTFSGEDINDIRIGIFSEDIEASNGIIENLRGENIKIAMYDKEDICKEGIIKGDVHLCTVFLDDENKENNNIIFYYDNTQFNLAKSILEYLKERVGFTAQQITLETTEALLDHIDNSLIFMQQMLDELDILKTEVITIKGELNSLHSDLIDVQHDFLPKYQRIKEIEPIINSTKIEFVKKKGELENETARMIEILSGVNKGIVRLEDLLDNLNNIRMLNAGEDVNITDINTTNITIDAEEYKKSLVEEILNNTREIKRMGNLTIMSMNKVIELLNDTEKETINISIELSKTIKELDKINDLLNTSIEITDRNIKLIDKGIENIDIKYGELDDKIKKFEELRYVGAEDIVKPISAEYISILKEKNKVRLLFPTLMVIILLFISIVLSNIVVLNEINSSASFRSVLLPVPDIIIILSMYLTNLIIVSVQIAVLLLIAELRFGMNIIPILGDVGISLVVLSTIFIFIGMIIAYIIKNKQTSILISIFVTLAMFLYSNMLFPIEGMSKLAAIGAKANPVVIGESILKKILLFSIGIEGVNVELLRLLTYAIILFFVMILAYKRNMSRR